MAATRLFLFSFFSFFLLQLHSSSAQSQVKGVYWYSGSEFPPANINSALFTHIFCAFASVNPSNQITIPPSFSTFTQIVQRKNPSIKTLISIGGGGGESVTAPIASMASQASSRKAFIDSSIKVARANNFHGLDLDWEYPTSTSQMTSMGILFNEWRTAINAEAKQSGKSPLLLTAATSFSTTHESLRYPVNSIIRNLDWINAMAYDFKGPTWSPDFTGAPAALYDPLSSFSGSAGVNTWIAAGLSNKKIVLGLPYYGYAWKLKNPNNNGIGAPANGPDTSFNSEGTVVYSRIKEFIRQTRATSKYNSTYATNYCYSGSTWIGFDDTQSIAAKVSFAKTQGLLGYFAWQVSGDANWTLSQQASQTWGQISLFVS